MLSINEAKEIRSKNSIYDQQTPTLSALQGSPAELYNKALSELEANQNTP